MANAINKAYTTQFCLIKIDTVEGLSFRFQNYLFNEPYVFQNEIYDYASIQYNGAARSLSVENSETDLILPNTAQIRSYLNQYNNFKNSVFIIHEIFPDISGQEPLRYLLRCGGISRDGAKVVIKLKTSLSAIGASFPTKRFKSGTGNGNIGVPFFLPEVPRTTRVNTR